MEMRSRVNIFDDENLRTALVKSATGYEVEEREYILDRNGNSTGKIKVTKKYIPPSVKALEAIQGMMNTGRWDKKENNY